MENKAAPAILIVPPAIEEVIAKFDGSETPLDEHAVKQELVAARGALANPTEAENSGAWAEVLAFALSGNARHYSPWNTYFGPIASGTLEDGRPFYSPDIAGTSAEVVQHWIGRAKSVKHPVLKARYADLAWDMSRAIANTNPDPDMARIAIDAYLGSLATGVQPDIHNEFEAVIRALDLAQMLRDKERIDAARGALLRLHRKAVEKAQGLWWKAFDRLIDDKHAGLTDPERDQIVTDLEALTARFSDSSDPKTFDPHAAESAAKRLIAYYNKHRRRDDAVRLHQIVARSFEHAASLADPMLASAFLENSVQAYRQAGLKQESKRARVAMEEKIEQSHSQMQTFTHEVTITKDDMERFLEGVVVDDLGATFARIASSFLEPRSKLEAEVEEQVKNAPLLSMIGQSVIAGRHVAAKIGSVEDDPLGRVIAHAAQSMSFNDIWLHNALERAIEKHSLTPEHFVGWIISSGLYADPALLMEGVRAWFQEDFVKAIHVLVPQVEAGLRQIVGTLGKATTKPHGKVQGVSVAINMGDILYDNDITAAVGADFTLHCLALYADPRGVNLRNEIAHGLVGGGHMGGYMAARLIHTLLVLGVWDQIAKARETSGKDDDAEGANS